MSAETPTDAARPLTIADLTRTRVEQPELIAERAATRRRPQGRPGASGRLLVIAADHPARGALRAGDDPLAMADRRDLLGRLVDALARPGVNGFLGTADLVEDLLLLGALEGKAVFGSMNRGGLAGSAFEIDDRFTGYDAAAIEAQGLDGGKMLLRIDAADQATARMLEAAGRAVDELAARQLVAMVEPFLSRRVPSEPDSTGGSGGSGGSGGRLVNDLTADAVIRSIAVAAGLGSTSAYTWLKLPVVVDPDDPRVMDRVLGASTLPTLLLGGEVAADQDAMFERWRAALAVPSVVGLTVGRSLLYPPDGDVAAAVDTAAGLL